MTAAPFYARLRHQRVRAVANVENPVLEHLSYIHGAIDEMREDIREIKQRVGTLEHQYASISTRMDRMDTRIERIEKRLDLTDA